MVRELGMSTVNLKQPKNIEWVRRLMFIYGVVSMVLLAVMVVLLGLVNCQPGTSYCNPSIKSWSPWLIAGGGLFLLKFTWDISSRKRRAREVKQYALFRTTTVSRFDDLVGVGQFAFAATTGFTTMQILRLRLGVSDSLAVAVFLTVMVFLLAYFPRLTGVKAEYPTIGVLFIEKVSLKLGGGVGSLAKMAVVFGVGVYVLARLFGVK